MADTDQGDLLAQTRAFNAELERLLATLPSVHTLPPQETRQARREGRGIYPAPVFSPDARLLQIDGPAGPLSLRVIDPPEASRGVFLHIHGGDGPWGRTTCRTLVSAGWPAIPG